VLPCAQLSACFSGGGGTARPLLSDGVSGRCILAVAGQHEFAPTDKGFGKVGLLRWTVIAQGYMPVWTEELPHVPLGGAAGVEGFAQGCTACRVLCVGLFAFV